MWKVNDDGRRTTHDHNSALEPSAQVHLKLLSPNHVPVRLYSVDCAQDSRYFYVEFWPPRQSVIVLRPLRQKTYGPAAVAELWSHLYILSFSREFSLKLTWTVVYEGHPKITESCWISREPWQVAYWNFTYLWYSPILTFYTKYERNSMTSYSGTSFRLTSYPRFRSRWDFLISFHRSRFQECLMKTLPIGYER